MRRSISLSRRTQEEVTNKKARRHPELYQWQLLHLIGEDVIGQDGKAVLYDLMDCIRKEGKNIVLCDRIYSCGAGNKVADQIAAYFNRRAFDLFPCSLQC